MAEEPNKPNVVAHGKAPGAPRQVPNNFSGDYIRTDGSMGNAARDDERHKKEIEEELKRNAALREQNAEENPPAKQASQELKDATNEFFENRDATLVDPMNSDAVIKRRMREGHPADPLLTNAANALLSADIGVTQPTGLLRYDQNPHIEHDHKISTQEISRLSKNATSGIQWDEASQVEHEAARKRIFDALNTNGDSHVSIAEIDAAAQALRHRKIDLKIENIEAFHAALNTPLNDEKAPNDRGFSLDDFKNHQNLSADKQEQMKRFLDSNGNGTLEAGEFLTSANRALIDRGVTETSERNAIINSLATTFTPSKIPTLPPSASENKNR